MQNTSLVNATPPRVPGGLKKRMLFAQESAESVVLSPLAIDFEENDKQQSVRSPSPLMQPPPPLINSLLDSIFEFNSYSPLLLPPGGLKEEGEEGLRKILISTFKLERFVWYGIALCSDQLLSLAVLLPMRVCLQFMPLLLQVGNFGQTRNQRFTADICLAVIIITSLVCSVHMISAAQIYHAIRLQTFMKLYVVINIAEVVDRLLCSMGNDMFDLLGDSILRNNVGKIVFRTLLCSIYTCAHSILFYIRVLTLSVAMNSSSDALFTILVSNNFVELKGSVFKRSTEENLFQIACSDIVERFVLVVFMGLVGLSEFTGQSTESNDDGGSLGEESTEASIVPQFLLLWSTVLVAEVVVDWIKHSFICRFNSDIRAKEAYDKFLSILATDFKHNASAVFPQVTKRLGLPVVPLCVVLFRVVLFDVQECRLGFVCMVWLCGFACKQVLKVTCLDWVVKRAIAEPTITATASTAVVSTPQSTPTHNINANNSSRFSPQIELCPTPEAMLTAPPTPIDTAAEEEGVVVESTAISTPVKKCSNNSNASASSSATKKRGGTPKTLFNVNRFETTV